MKTYGKTGHRRRLFTKADSEEIQFSDDEGIFDEAISECTTEVESSRSKIDFDADKDENEINLTEQVCCKEKNGKELTNKRRESTHFEMFNFLENTDKTKRRKTHHSRVGIQDADIDSNDEVSGQDTQSFQNTIDSVNEMLSSIKSSESADLLLENTIEDDHYLSNSETRGTYGRKRTILYREDGNSQSKSAAEEEEEQKKQEEDDDEEDEQEEQTGEAQDDGTTHHFNQLKTMGESLKFQDDLEFIMSDSSNDVQSFVSRLLSFSLDIASNEDLRAYIIKYQHQEVWKWCFKYSDPANSTMLFLQAFIAATIPLDQGQSLWGMLDIDNFIIPLTSQRAVEVEIKGTKFMEQNYREFLEKTESRSGLYYALILWPKCLNQQNELSEQQCESIIDLCRDEVEFMELLLEVIESSITISDNLQTRHTIFYTKLFDILNMLIGDLPDNVTIVKSLIKLTNNHNLTSSFPIEQRVDLLNQCLSCLAGNDSIFEGKDNTPKASLGILHLGLALNLLLNGNTKTISVEEPVFSKLETVFRRCLNYNAKYNFGENMLLLVFAYVCHNSNRPLDSDDHSAICLRLRDFSKEMKIYNESIHIGIQTLLDII